MHGVVSDCADMYKYFVKNYNVQIDRGGYLVQMGGQKASILNKIQEFLSQDRQEYIIYYTGHGDSSEGAMCIGEELISPNEIHDIWYNTYPKIPVGIIR